MNATTTKRTGPKMLALAAYVAAHPGCSMMDAAGAVGPHGSLQFGYRTAHRARRAGLVHSIRGAGRYRLYPIATA